MRNPIVMAVKEIFAIVATILVWFIGKRAINLIIPDDYLIDAIFIVAIILFLFHRSAHPRFFWYGFFCLTMGAFASVFQVGSLTYFLSSFTFVFLTVGAINMLCFEKIQNVKSKENE